MLYIYAIVLFSGQDPVSRLIKDITGSEYSHVGLILKDADTKELYVFESTGSFSQIVWEYQVPQVQMHRLSTVEASYDGKIVMRKIRNRAAKMTDVRLYVTKLLGTPYERNLGDLLRALARDNTKEDTSSLFCSELVAKTLKDHGLLQAQRLNDNYMPKDFSEREGQQLSGLQLGPEVSLHEAERKCSLCILH